MNLNDLFWLLLLLLLFLQNTEILLSDEKIKVIKQSHEAEIPYQVHSIGIYLVIEAKNGLILIWNKKTTLMIKLNPSYKVHEQTGHLLLLLLLHWIIEMINKR